MKHFTSSLPDIAERLSASVKEELSRLIFEQLRLQVEPILEEAAQRLAADLTGKVRTYRQRTGEPAIVTLQIDGIEKAIRKANAQ